MKGSQPGKGNHAKTENIVRRAALSFSPGHAPLVEGGGENNLNYLH